MRAREEGRMLRHSLGVADVEGEYVGRKEGVGGGGKRVCGRSRESL